VLQSIATLITAVGVLLGVLTLRASQRQRLRQFESFYVARYWHLMDGLSLAALRGDEQSDVSDDDEKVVRSYVRLCEDECELRRDGWIGDATWTLWSDGMRAQFKRWPFAPVWERVRDEDERQYEHLRRVLRGDERAIRPTHWRRVASGLAGPARV
jgi:hypothetical protein